MAQPPCTPIPKPVEITVRRADCGDAEAIARVLADAFAEYRSLYTEAAFTATTADAPALLARIAEGPVWVAQREGATVGTAATLAREDGIYIRGMAVVRAAQGHGVAGRMLDVIERGALSEGQHRLYLSTTPFLADAIRLYERAGFVRTTAGPHDLFGTPLFTMEKRLPV